MSKEWHRQYYLKNRQKLIEVQKQYRSYKTPYLREYRQRIRNRLFEILGYKCVMCGYSDIRALEFDHINDDGYLERVTAKYRTAVYFNYGKDPEAVKKKLQVLCCNCNRIKRIEYLRRMMKN